MDFFTVPTLNFKTLYVYVVLDHGRRKVVHWAVTGHPTMDWVVQQLREATPFGEQPRFLFRDNDSIYGHGVPAFLNRCGIQQVRTAYRSPWQNPYVERFIGTLRRELLDHIIVMGQSHVERLLDEYIDDYYRVSRPHQGLDGDTPIPQEECESIVGATKLMSIPVLGGLHHSYVRVAA
jgi:transposase InsO family protein